MKNRKYLWLLLTISFIGLAYGSANYHKKAFPRKVDLITLGKTKPEQVALVKKEIERFYGFSVNIIPEKPLPKEAFYPPRNRYKANKLLKYLSGLKDEDDNKIIALVQQDISTKSGEHEDWGVIGLAIRGGSSCIVSTFRLGKDHPTKEKFNDRLVKAVLHELGHTLGLEHCDQSADCLMNDAKGSIRTVDREKKVLCQQCQKKIAYTF